MKKLIASVMSIALFASIATTSVHANNIGVDGSSGDVPVELTVETPIFNVTVPTALPISVAADGIVTVASNVEVVNDSHGPVSVTGIAITPANSWVMDDYTQDFLSLPVGTKKLGLVLNNCSTKADGTLDFKTAEWASIPAKSATSGKLPIVYNAKVAMQGTAVAKVSVGNVVFTIDWTK